MGVESDSMTSGIVAGHLEKARRAALGPIDTKTELQAVWLPPTNRDLFHHGEVVIGGRRVLPPPALANVVGELGLVDRQRIYIALVLEHRRHGPTDSNLPISFEYGPPALHPPPPPPPPLIDHPPD